MAQSRSSSVRDDLTEKPQRTPDELKNDLVVAQRRLQQLVAEKKNVLAQYNADIADAKEEIAGILRQLQ